MPDDEETKPKKRRGPRPGEVKKPTKGETERRRAEGERLLGTGHSIADICRELPALVGGTWSPPTVRRDIEIIRARWGEDCSTRTRDSVRAELERMSRLVF